MEIRKHLLPRRLLDFVCFLIVFILSTAVFLFEITYILPAFYATDTFTLKLHWVFAFFIFFNIKGNLLYCIFVDTSYHPDKQLQQQQQQQLTTSGWNYCEKCAQLSPPRSRHCNICKVCILKRDHHCLFTGCCIGHKNHRYFLLFLLYFFIGCVYASVYNSMYMWVLQADIYCNWWTLFKMLYPPLMIFYGSITSSMYIVLYSLVGILVCVSLTILSLQISMMIRGVVSYENLKKINDYNLGWRQNMLLIFGENWRLVWIAPFIRSKQNHDGLNWKTTTANEHGFINVENDSNNGGANGGGGDDTNNENEKDKKL